MQLCSLMCRDHHCTAQEIVVQPDIGYDPAPYTIVVSNMSF